MKKPLNKISTENCISSIRHGYKNLRESVFKSEDEAVAWLEAHNFDDNVLIQVAAIDMIYERCLSDTQSFGKAYQSVASRYERIVQELEKNEDFDVAYHIYLGRKDWALQEEKIGQEKMAVQKKQEYQTTVAAYQKKQQAHQQAGGLIKQWGEIISHPSVEPSTLDINSKSGNQFYFKPRKTPRIVCDEFDYAHHDFIQLHEPLPEKPITFFSLRKTSARLNFTIYDVPGDGNCFFHAVFDQLREKVRLTHDDLRQDAINYLANHRDEFKDFFSNDTEGGYVYVNFEDYLHKAATGGHWADHLIIQALANARHLSINIYDIDGTLKCSVKPNDGKISFEVNLLHNRNHYQSLRPLFIELDTNRAPVSKIEHLR